MLEEEVRIGDIYRVGNTILQVAQPRIPCAKLNDRMGMRFSPVFLASRKVGFYLRVLQEGSVAKGDTIELLERDEASPTMEEFVRVTQFEYWDAQALQHLLQGRDLMPAWREIIETKLARTLSALGGWHGLREFVVVRREQECEVTVSLYLKCKKGSPLPAFHGGQKLTVVLGGHSANQQRRAYAISSNPENLDTYRITVRRVASPDETLPAGVVSSHLVTMKIGEHVLCAAPHGALLQTQKDVGSDRIPVLVCHGMGIAAILSLLYELETINIPAAYLFYEAVIPEPQKLMSEVRELLVRNSGFHMIENEVGKITADLICQHVPLKQADLHIAGSRNFVEQLANELVEAGLASSDLIVQSFG